MNDEQLNRIGFSNLRNPYTSNINTTTQNDNLPIPKNEPASPNSLNLQSNINGNTNYFMCDNNNPHNHDKCTKATKNKWASFAPYSFNKLNQQEKDKTFLQLYDDYRGTRQHLNEQQHKCKRLSTKLHSLQNQIARLKGQPTQKGRIQKQKNDETVQLKKQITRLHQKIIALTGNQYKVSNNRPKTANKTQKILIPANENIRAELESERKHIRQLLLIIDQLKKGKFQVEQLLRQKQTNQSVVRTNKNQSRVGGGVLNSESKFQDYANQLHTWKQKYDDLELVFNRMNEDKDKKIKELANQLVNIKENARMKEKLQRRTGTDFMSNNINEQKLQELTDEKDKLERQLRKLTQMPFYQNNKQIVESQQKITTLQNKYEITKRQTAKLLQTNSQNLAELQFKTRENTLLKTQNEKLKKQLKEAFQKQHSKAGMKMQQGDLDYDDYYRKKLALVHLQGTDPVWKQFQSLAKPQINTLTEQNVRKLAQKLWLNKLQLLAHLQKAQIQLKTLKQGMDARVNVQLRDKQLLQEQLKITRARLDQWKGMDNMNRNRQFKVYEQLGIKYDDSVSVFDAQEQELRDLESNQNYFDLYLGNLNIDEAELMRNPQNKVKNMTHFVSFLTVDFYNHQTQHSNFVEGSMKKLNNNYSFKVQVNSPFLKYLSKNSISLQLWSPQGTATVLLGKGHIYLSDLVNNAAQDISGVVRGKSQIYCDKRLVATVEYRLRMRLPIHSFIQWAQAKNQFKLSQAKDMFAQGKRKILQISVDRAENLPAGINAFVYFLIQGDDFFTEPARGPSPIWNFKQTVEVHVNEDFINELKQKYIQFTVFDDEKQVNQDVYGIAKASFTPLVQFSDQLQLNLDIQDQNGHRIGKLKIRARWISY